MKAVPIFAVALLSSLVISCERHPRAPIMVAYHDGHAYEIIEKGDIKDQGKPAHFIRYYSAAPTDATIRMAEQEDLLAILAKHIDTNKHQRVVIIAVERDVGFFGFEKPEEVSESIAAEKVLTYKPETGSGEQL